MASAPPRPWQRGAVLITLAALHGNGWQLGAAIVFGVALLLLYVASTLYHAVQHPVAKGRLKVFDHCAIYLLIAGTYTPFTLVGLRGPVGWWLFGAIWTLALAGVVFKLFYTGRFKRLSTSSTSRWAGWSWSRRSRCWPRWMRGPWAGCSRAACPTPRARRSI
jgi:channel protein (hemolysin III family)